MTTTNAARPTIGQSSVRWVKYRDLALSEALRLKIGTQRHRPLVNQDVICRLLSLLQTSKHIMQSIECIRKHYNFKLFLILLGQYCMTYSVCVVMSWRNRVMLLWALAINNILAWGVKYPNTTSIYKYDVYTDQVFTQVENRRNILLCVPTSFSQVVNRRELMWVYDYWGSVSTCSLFITSLCPPPLLPHSLSAVWVSCQIVL